MLGKQLWQTILTFGLGLGITRFGINLAAAEFGGSAMLFESLPLAGFAMGITIIAMIWVGYRLRDQNRGLIDLQSAFLGMFGVYAVAGLLTVLCNAAYFFVFRPEVLAGLSEYAQRLSNEGMTREYLSSLIFGGLLAMIFAFVLKKEKVKVAS